MRLIPWKRDNGGLGMLQSQMNRLFDDFWPEDERQGIWAPAVDIDETEDTVIARAEMPGIGVDDIDIQIVNNCLLLKGEKREEEASGGKTWQRVERRYGAFNRALPLPCAVDMEKVGAEMDKGVLTITMAKQESEKPRKINVRAK